MPALRFIAFQQSFYLGCLRGQLKRNNVHRHVLLPDIQFTGSMDGHHDPAAQHR